MTRLAALLLLALPARSAPVPRSPAVVPAFAAPGAAYAAAAAAAPSAPLLPSALPSVLALPAPNAAPPLSPAPSASAASEAQRARTAPLALARDLARELSGVSRPARVEEVVPGVYHLRFPSQRSLAKAFVRFQEHYESPKYRGKAFTLAEFAEWYAAQKPHGRFSYYRDWDGFNIPSRVLRRFEAGDFDPLSPQEKALLSFAASKRGRFYLIGTRAGRAQEATLRHETAHGLWYTDPEYRRRAKAILKGVDLAPVFAALDGLGYHRSVWLDEAHAWIGDPPADLRSIGADPRPYREVRRRLLALYREYAH